MTPFEDQRANYAIEAIYDQQDKSHVTCWELYIIHKADKKQDHLLSQKRLGTLLCFF